MPSVPRGPIAPPGSTPRLTCDYTQSQQAKHHQTPANGQLWFMTCENEAWDPTECPKANLAVDQSNAIALDRCCRTLRVGGPEAARRKPTGEGRGERKLLVKPPNPPTCRDPAPLSHPRPTKPQKRFQKGFADPLSARGRHRFAPPPRDKGFKKVSRTRQTPEKVSKRFRGPAETPKRFQKGFKKVSKRFRGPTQPPKRFQKGFGAVSGETRKRFQKGFKKVSERFRFAVSARGVDRVGRPRPQMARGGPRNLFETFLKPF